MLSQMLALGESVPVFCNFVCDMTVRLEEADKVLDKPTFHVKPGELKVQFDKLLEL